MLLLAALLLIALIVWWVEGHYRQWQRNRAEVLKVCTAQGHDLGPVEHALDSPWWPYQRCKRCKQQFNLNRCAACKKLIKDGKVCDGD